MNYPFLQRWFYGSGAKEAAYTYLDLKIKKNKKKNKENISFKFNNNFYSIS